MSNRLIILASVVVFSLLSYAIVLEGAHTARARELATAISAGDTKDAKPAAWLFAEAPRGSMSKVEAALTEKASDPDLPAEVLESYVYALGRHFAGTGQNTALIAAVIRRDTADFPRQAAWLALARIDRQKYLSLANEYAQSENLWDQWGILRGRLELGDFSDVGLLWRWGAGDDWDRRQHAARMVKWRIAPLLEAVGRWPLELESVPTDSWLPEHFALLRARIEGVDLVALAADSLVHFERSGPVRSAMGKVTGGRDRIKQWLFGR